jgi:hypothetical protein
VGRLYKRGEVWWGDWRDARGARHQRSLRTRDRVVAKQRLRDLELGLAETNLRAQGPPLGEAVIQLLDVV